MSSGKRKEMAEFSKYFKDTTKMIDNTLIHNRNKVTNFDFDVLLTQASKRNFGISLY